MISPWRVTSPVAIAWHEIALRRTTGDCPSGTEGMSYDRLIQIILKYVS
jgi:hypothetical protein